MTRRVALSVGEERAEIARGEARPQRVSSRRAVQYRAAPKGELRTEMSAAIVPISSWRRSMLFGNALTAKTAS
jgi:hypothetical protein